MLLRFSLLLAFLGCVTTRDDFSRNDIKDINKEFNRRFALWPSVHNGATLLRLRRQNTDVGIPGPNEGIAEIKLQEVQAPANTSLPVKTNNETIAVKSEAPKAEVAPAQNSLQNETPNEKTPANSPTPIVNSTAVKIKDNGTTVDTATKQWDFSNPDVTKRVFIVFGGFALLAMAYFIFYRTKSRYKETNSSNTSNDANQFRYGVLQSEDMRDNLELSRVPLTMESDDDDEDLEIFDLEQKRKTMSYVNLHATDEEIVLSPRDPKEPSDGLLLDIEDGDSDTLINWSNNGTKSIL